MPMHLKTLCALFAPLLLAVTVRAADPPPARPEYTNPGFANPDTPGLMAGKPAANVPNTVDVIFLQQLSIGGNAEVTLGKLARERGADAVKTFGSHMVDDHTGANGKLTSLARAAHVELPEGLDAKHEEMRRQLSGLSGTDFDLRYVDGQIVDHQDAVNLLIYEIGQGQHGGVRQFAAQTLPVVMAHLEAARALHDQLVTR
jgi:putative membrane protein